MQPLMQTWSLVSACGGRCASSPAWVLAREQARAQVAVQQPLAVAWVWEREQAERAWEQWQELAPWVEEFSATANANIPLSKTELQSPAQPQSVSFHSLQRLRWC